MKIITAGRIYGGLICISLFTTATILPCAALSPCLQKLRDSYGCANWQYLYENAGTFLAKVPQLRVAPTSLWNTISNRFWPQPQHFEISHMNIMPQDLSPQSMDEIITEYNGQCWEKRGMDDVQFREKNEREALKQDPKAVLALKAFSILSQRNADLYKIENAYENSLLSIKNKRYSLLSFYAGTTCFLGTIASSISSWNKLSRFKIPYACPTSFALCTSVGALLFYWAQTKIRDINLMGKSTNLTQTLFTSYMTALNGDYFHPFDLRNELSRKF